MALRTTRQCVEVLASTAVVSQQYDVGATSALALSDAAGRSCSLGGGATIAIALADSATAAHVHVLAAASALALSDGAAPVEFVAVEVAASSTITLDVTAGCVVMRVVATENHLTLADEASRVEFLTTELDANSAISAEAVADVLVVRAVAAESALVLSQQAPVGRPWHIFAESALQISTQEYDPTADAIVTRIDGLQDLARVARPLTAAITQSIPLRQSASVVRVKATAIDVLAQSALELLGEIRTNQTGVAHDWLIVSQSATVDKCKPAKSVLELTARALVVRNSPCGAASTLSLNQAATFHIVSGGVLQQYHPFVGEGAPGSPTPPPVTLTGPLPGIMAPFQLVYPAAGEVTDSVTLRAPNLGNKDRLSFNRILRETRGGTLIVFADPIWPKLQTLVLSFSGLRRSEVHALLRFFDDYLGQEVGMIDWEQRYWRGVIMTPDEPVVEDSFNSYSVSFEFEGELDKAWSPQVVPWLPGMPLRRVRPSRDYGPVNPLEPEPRPAVPESAYTAEADVAILAGQPLYIKPSGHAELARADAAATAAVAGFAVAAAEPGFTVNYVTEGKLTLADWTPLLGSAGLVPGTAYFLDAVAGRITAMAPQAPGLYVVRVGRAASTLTLDIEIEPPVRL